MLGRVGIRLILLGVGLAGLVLPVLALLALDAFSLHLVQQTELRLLGQGAVVAQAYRLAWAGESQRPVGDPRPLARRDQRYAPFRGSIQSLSELAEPLPSPFPKAHSVEPAALRAGQRLQRILEDSLIFHLTGVRVVDREGTVVASSQPEVGYSLAGLNEVQRALAGEYRAVLRQRVSDEPAPPLGSLSRRGKLRVFSAQPIFDAGVVIGVVYQSRTAETSVEWLWEQRRGLLLFSAALILLALLLSVGFARTIERPLRAMSQAAKAIADGRQPESGVFLAGGPREVQLLARSLDTMNQQIQRRNRYITEFVSTVGHELKSPLTSITGASEILSEEWDQIPPAQRQRFLSNIRAAAERTTLLVTKLLTLARAENPAIVAERQDIDLLRLRDDLLEHHPDQVEVTVVGNQPRVWACRDELDCVLNNLLDNALRYRNQSKVKVLFTTLPSGHLQIEVENDGPPISPGNQARVFDRFFTTERDAGGTGLGLSIVKALAEARGGSAAVSSDDRRTRFTVVL